MAEPKTWRNLVCLRGKEQPIWIFATIEGWQPLRLGPEHPALLLPVTVYEVETEGVTTIGLDVDPVDQE